MKTKILLLFALLCVLCVSALNSSAQETVPQTQTILKSYFMTGSVPKQTNYWELIDTMFWYINATYTNSQNAVAIANAAHSAPTNPPVSCVVQPWYVPLFFNTNGCTVNPALPTNNYGATIYFSAPFADTNFFILFSTNNVTDHSRGTAANAGLYADVKTTTYVHLRGTTTWASEIGFYPYNAWNQILLNNNMLPMP